MFCCFLSVPVAFYCIYVSSLKHCVFDMFIIFVGFGAHAYKHLTLFDMKTAFPGPVMGNVGFTKEIAEGAIRSGAADLIAFGRPTYPTLTSSSDSPTTGH